MVSNIYQLTAFALLAAFGALARQLNGKDNRPDNEPVQILSFVSGCIIAAFMGVIIYFITDSFDNINQNISYAAAGISGWVGPRLLDKIGGQVLKLAGIDAEDRGGQKNEKD